MHRLCSICSLAGLNCEVHLISEFDWLRRYRMSEVDRINDFKGKVREMWTVDQVKIHEGTAYFAFTKIGVSSTLLELCWSAF